MCDRIAIIQKGNVRKSGTLSDIRKAFHEKVKFVVQVSGDAGDVQEAIRKSVFADQAIGLKQEPCPEKRARLDVEIDHHSGSISGFIEWLVVSGFRVESCVKQEPSLNELFERSIRE